MPTGEYEAEEGEDCDGYPVYGTRGPHRPDGNIPGSSSVGGDPTHVDTQIPDPTLPWDSVPDILPKASGSGSANSNPTEQVSKDLGSRGIRAPEGVVLGPGRETVSGSTSAVGRHIALLSMAADTYAQ